MYSSDDVMKIIRFLTESTEFIELWKKANDKYIPMWWF